MLLVLVVVVVLLLLPLLLLLSVIVTAQAPIAAPAPVGGGGGQRDNPLLAGRAPIRMHPLLLLLFLFFTPALVVVGRDEAAAAMISRLPVAFPQHPHLFLGGFCCIDGMLEQLPRLGLGVVVTVVVARHGYSCACVCGVVVVRGQAESKEGAETDSARASIRSKSVQTTRSHARGMPTTTHTDKHNQTLHMLIMPPFPPLVQVCSSGSKTKAKE